LFAAGLHLRMKKIQSPIRSSTGVPPIRIAMKRLSLACLASTWSAPHQPLGERRVGRERQLDVELLASAYCRRGGRPGHDCSVM